jgi:prepilin-type N-terminal cleavage/methylation domain-containing protein
MNISRTGNPRGFSLIELVVAIVMSTLVLGAAFSAWVLVNKHTVSGKRKAVLQAETDRMVRTIASQIRTAPAVVAWTDRSITMIAAGSGDTLVWAFDGDSLSHNDTMVRISSPRARVTDFHIADLTEGNTSPRGALLSVSLTMRDDFGDESRVSMQAAAARAAGKANEFGQ